MMLPRLRTLTTRYVSPKLLNLDTNIHSQALYITEYFISNKKTGRQTKEEKVTEEDTRTNQGRGLRPNQELYNYTG